MTPEDLQPVLTRALATVDPTAGAVDFTVVRPVRSELGDWSSNIALRAARTLKLSAEALATAIVEQLHAEPAVAIAAVSGPGFVNITLTAEARSRLARDIAEFGPSFDSAEAGKSARWSAGQVDPVVINDLQLGHAAGCRTQRRARAAGISGTEFAGDRLDHPKETTLLTRLAEVFSALDRSVDSGDPQTFAASLSATATALGDWLETCTVTPPIDEDITVRHSSRFVLAHAATSVLAAGLRLLGASAPERM